ncbi:DNA polymerase III subunit alpha [Propioniciclava sp. MC1683]|uniref:DNA polymerase III subunit alpha n=1 Tax=Propioniciclava sp. MC1683 TaxID=2760309 RepID=UPI0016048E02|nr:DNA polymerase III subunit alpha [Propioniciclava sp. MC1683]MBB1500173.1 DNA polymerase III subunit alpha [Propioniciclava sp. MC1683]
MTDPFVHLRVASGYSLQYGASHPSVLVEAAAGHDMDTLALTDRDGLYGAVRFAKACMASGVAPVVGADLAVEGAGRAVVLAESRRGWGSLCRLVTATHARGERGAPVTTRSLVGEHRDDVVVVLGPDSDLGSALVARDERRAEAALRGWLEVVEAHQLVIGVTDHHLAGAGVGSARLAGRMLAFADAHGVAGVLTNAVRMARKSDAPVADVLDAARRLVPLDVRNVDRRNAEGYLKSGKEMLATVEEVTLLAGRRDPARLVADTRHLALRCRLDPVADLGIGEIHLPEFPGGIAELRARCEAGLGARYAAPAASTVDRLDDELAVIEQMGFAAYFLTVAQVVDSVREMGIRVAARGSGAGSLVNYCLGISGVDPIAYDLIMERFLSPLRRALPDIDIDVESARRLEVYDRVFADFGADRVAAVAMLDTYRVRHAIRDVGAAMSLPPGDIDQIAKSFPHIRARDVRHALRELPELRRANLGDEQLRVLFELVEGLDGLPRHVALHPCGVILSDATLGERTPVESSFGGYAMSQFDKDDVEDLGLLKLDILGIRMQSSMAHALDEVERISGERIDIDALAPYDDPDVYGMISRAETIGCFQIESPGQRELVGKFSPSEFNDLVIDISLFRPGPVKSDMVVPFLRARNGWSEATYLHPDLVPALAETRGVIVFHEQVIKVVAVMTGCSLAYGDEARRALGSPEGQEDVRHWFYPAARAQGYAEALIDDVWAILVSFASFGFCKAHAAAFALPTYQSAWLKWHHPAAFVSGLLTHDPGMYPKRLILAEARRMGVPVLPLDVNASGEVYRVEAAEGDGTLGVRLALTDVKNISAAEVERIVAGQPYAGLVDFWQRARPGSDVAEHLVLAGAFDALYGIGSVRGPGARGRVTRRDLLLTLADLERLDRVDARAHGRARGLGSGGATGHQAVQLALDFTEPATCDVVVSGLPEMTAEERMAAELAVLGMDATRHVMEDHREFVEAIGVTHADEQVKRRSGSRLLVAGVKVATQTPPVKSGKRVVFLTLDDGTGPVDLTFFEDAQGPFATTVFNSWLLVGVGELRRTGARGVSLRALGAWDLLHLEALWRSTLEATGDPRAAVAAVHELVDADLAARAAAVAEGERARADWNARAQDRPYADGDGGSQGERARRRADTEHAGAAGGMGQRRVLIHPSGFVQSPYTDVAPAGESPRSVPRKFADPGRKLWHSSPGSSGR